MILNAVHGKEARIFFVPQHVWYLRNEFECFNVATFPACTSCSLFNPCHNFTRVLTVFFSAQVDFNDYSVDLNYNCILQTSFIVRTNREMRYQEYSWNSIVRSKSDKNHKNWGLHMNVFTLIRTHIYYSTIFH